MNPKYIFSIFFFFQEWVDVKVLEVNEGGRALITSDHLKVVVDYDYHGIPDSGVLFHMVSPPSRGRLDVAVWNRQEDNIFTLVDLNTDQVSKQTKHSFSKIKLLSCQNSDSNVHTMNDLLICLKQCQSRQIMKCAK